MEFNNSSCYFSCKFEINKTHKICAKKVRINILSIRPGCKTTGQSMP